MINLILNWYCSPDAARQQELDYCMLHNYNNPLIDRIIILAKKEDLICLPVEIMEDEKKKVSFIQRENRPTYNHYFGVTHLYMDCINIIANADICFSGSLELLKGIKFTPPKSDTMFALTRWEMQANGTAALLNQPDSQDVWVFFGVAEILDSATFTMGMAGCDNKIAYLLAAQGYQVLNPSKSIQCIHIHKSNHRTYNANEDRKKIQPPFKLIWPHEIAL